MGKINSGQSVVEYVVLFAIVVTLSILMIPRVRTMFSTYVATATGAMR